MKFHTELAQVIEDPSDIHVYILVLCKILRIQTGIVYTGLWILLMSTVVVNMLQTRR